MANFKNYSRYTGGQIATNREGQHFLVLRQPLNLQPSSLDTFVTITKELIQRPDLIAFKAYGNVDLWWVIYEFNNIYDPLFGISVGQTLRIPEINGVLAAINALSS